MRIPGQRVARAAGIGLLAAACLCLASADYGPAPKSSLAMLEESLDRLALDLLRQSPQAITSRGAARELGVRNDGLDSFALDLTGESYAPLRRAIEQAKAADLGQVNSRSRTAIATFVWWLESALGGRPFQDNVCLVSTYMTSVPQHLAWFMTHAHPLKTHDDAEDYLTRLAQIPERFDELTARLAASEAKRALAPGFLLAHAADEIEAIGREASAEGGLLGYFLERLGAISNLDEETRDRKSVV